MHQFDVLVPGTGFQGHKPSSSNSYPHHPQSQGWTNWPVKGRVYCSSITLYCSSLKSVILKSQKKYISSWPISPLHRLKRGTLRYLAISSMLPRLLQSRKDLKMVTALSSTTAQVDVCATDCFPLKKSVALV